MSAPTFISWFAGCGCFDDGLARAGWECRGACEIDPLAREVYERAHGRPAFFAEDIERVEAKEVPEADLWVGGFPCTDVSVAGQRAGIGEGTRSGLVHAFIRLAAERRPRFLLLENVPGLLSGRTADDPHREVERDAMGEPAVDSLWFGALLGALAGAGYAHGAWRVLDGQHFGVPQRRRRVFILLGRDPRDGAAAASVLLEPEGVRGRAPARGAPRAGAAAGAAGGAGGGGVVGPVLGVGPGSGYRHEVDGSNLANALRTSAGGADVARALNSSAQRFDASVENLVPAAKFFSITPEGGQGADLAAAEVALAPSVTPTSDGAKTDRGLRVVTFDMAQVTSATNRSRCAPGDPAPTLGASGWNEPCVAFDMAQVTHPENHARCRPGDPAPTLAESGQAHVAFLDAWSTRGSCSPNQHPVKEDGLSDALDTTSPGAVFAIRSDAVREGAAKTPCPDAEGRVRLRDPGMGVGEGVAPTVDAGAAHAVFPTLRGFGHGWQGQHNDDSSRANLVRRLTPVECERLQGLADGHTCTCGEAAAQRAALRAAGEPEWRRRRLPSLTRLCRCADGPRYRLVGNGGVTHVLAWIGSRLRAAMEGLR